MLQFAKGIAGHGKCRHAVEAILGFPAFRFESRQLKLDRQSGPVWFLSLSDECVDAVGEGFQNLLGVRRVALVFRVHVAAIAKAPGVDIALECGMAENFRKTSLAG